MLQPDGPAASYVARVQELIDEAWQAQSAAIDEAAGIVVDALAGGGLLHVFGTGHSHMLAEELYGRAGGLLPVHAILVPRLMLHEDMVEATLLERQAELAAEVLANETLLPGDAMLVISNSGRNGLSVEVARLARLRGLKVIALTAVAYSAGLPSRHPDGLHLFDVADVVLNNHGQNGDTCLDLPGSGLRTGPTSTVIGAVLLNAMMAETIARLAARGVTPPIMASSNLASSDDAGQLARLAQAGRRPAPGQEP